jgi:hypothetical protein
MSRILQEINMGERRNPENGSDLITIALGIAYEDIRVIQLHIPIMSSQYFSASITSMFCGVKYLVAMVRISATTSQTEVFGGLNE